MIPKFPEFKLVDESIKNEIAKFLLAAQPTVCELSMSNIYMWLHVDHTQATLINDNLCLYLRPDNAPAYFLEPLGNNKLVATVAICLQYAGRIACVSERFINQLAAVKAEYKISEMPEVFDYIYLTKEMAELKGQKFNAKRNHTHKFENLYPQYKFEAVNASLFEPAMVLFDKWAEKYQTSNTVEVAVETQRVALANALQHFSCCSFAGGYIEVDHQIAGIILGSPLNQDTFTVHFQYGLTSIPGIYQVLMRDFCAQLQAKFSYVNLESDLGIPGLRKMKLSYHPYKIEKKFAITS